MFFLHPYSASCAALVHLGFVNLLLQQRPPLVSPTHSAMSSSASWEHLPYSFQRTSENSCTKSVSIPNQHFTNISTAPLVFICSSLEITEFNHANTEAESVLAHLSLQGQIYPFEDHIQFCYIDVTSIILFPEPSCIFYHYSTHLQLNNCCNDTSITPNNYFLGLQHFPSPESSFPTCSNTSFITTVIFTPTSSYHSFPSVCLLM